MKVCRKCNIEKPLDEFYFRPSRNNYAPYCKPCWLKDTKKYRNKNPEKVKESARLTYQKNKDKYKLRRRNNPEVRVTSNLRNRLYKAVTLKFQGIMSLVGCELNELLSYLEQQFDENMNWDNYGTYWEIDHIKPCDSFDLEDLNEQIKCFHYTNLQPLSITENRKKSNKING